MWKNIFSFDGRIRRTEYGASFLIFVFGRIILSVLIAVIFLAADAENYGGLHVLGFLTSIPFLWFLWAQGAKRCHDIGKSGWWQLIPFFPLVMIFKEGDSQTNEYGDNPKGNFTNSYFETVNLNPDPLHQGQPRSGYNGGHNSGSEINSDGMTNSFSNTASKSAYRSGDLYKK